MPTKALVDFAFIKELGEIISIKDKRFFRAKLKKSLNNGKGSKKIEDKIRHLLLAATKNNKKSRKKRTPEDALLNELNLINEERPSRSSKRVREQTRDPELLPAPPAIPSPKVRRMTPNRTPKPPAPAAVQNLKTEKRSITEILNELYTNPDYPTVLAQI